LPNSQLKEELKKQCAEGLADFYNTSMVSAKVSDVEWILKQLPSKPKTLVLLFSSTVHGWSKTDWRSHCIDKGMTLTLMKSTKGKVAGGYLHIQWKDGKSCYGKDSSAFVFSVDNQLKLKPTDSDRAVYFISDSGPKFGTFSLGVSWYEMMNTPDNCWCCTNGHNDYYNVPTDARGNSILTGDGQGEKKNEKKFTLAAIETWAIKY
jgi:hypothetical protein